MCRRERTTENNDHLLSKSFFPARSINQTAASKTNNNNHSWRPPPPFYAHGLLSFVTSETFLLFASATPARGRNSKCIGRATLGSIGLWCSA